MQSLTVEQKAYHLRKMRTRFTRFDVNKDGHITLDDFRIIANRVVEYGKLPKDRADIVHATYTELAEAYGCKPGTKIALEEGSKKLHEGLIALPDDQWNPIFRNSTGKFFDALDINGDGVISVNEFVAYFKAVGLSEEESKKSFSIIDKDKNGEISREEFLAAANDFYRGTEETPLSEALFGPLVDQ